MACKKILTILYLVASVMDMQVNVSLRKEKMQPQVVTERSAVANTTPREQTAKGVNPSTTISRGPELPQRTPTNVDVS